MWAEVGTVPLIREGKFFVSGLGTADHSASARTVPLPLTSVCKKLYLNVWQLDNNYQGNFLGVLRECILPFPTLSTGDLILKQGFTYIFHLTRHRLKNRSKLCKKKKKKKKNLM